MLDTIDHVAVQVLNVRKALTWYRKNFECKVLYEDSTWALLEFANTKLALVTPGEHPPHFAVVDENLANEPDLKRHRDGIGYKYVKDPDNNFIEFIDQRS